MVSVEVVNKVLNGSSTQSKEEEMVQVLNAFNTSLIHFGSNKQFSTKLNESNYLYDPSVRVESFREESLLEFNLT